jgi:arylsulfatase A-like enzyme
MVSQPRPARPNILLIQADQHRYDCIGRAGHPLVQTPALDRLAAQGVWFSHAFTPTPTCCPARQSLLCGKWAEQHGGLWNYSTGIPVRDFDEASWTSALAAAGYTLGYVGRWEVHPRRTPLDYGFREWAAGHDYAAWRKEAGLPAPLLDAEHDPALRDQPAARWFGGVDPVPLEQTKTHWYAARAIEMIRHYQALGDGQPWHLRLDFDEPHLPCFPAAPYADAYAPESIPPWGSFAETFANKPYIQRQQLASWGIEHLTWMEWSRYLARYLGMVSQIDDAVARVLRALDELGAAESTLVIYTTDHGDNCGGHRLIDKHYVMYEDVVHVPLIVRWPGMALAGAVCEEFVVHALDLASTACEAAGLPIPATYQGRSLLPLLRGEAVPDWRTAAVATYHGAQFGLYEQRMWRDRRYKYVWNPTDVDELYDLQEDPWELYNHIEHTEYKEILAQLRGRLLAQLTAQGDGIVRTAWMQGQLREGRKLGARMKAEG